MGFQTKPIIIDGRGHLLGRLASIVAKCLLQAQRIVVVRCEEINRSGHFYRNKLKYLDYLRKRCNVNPRRGPFHYRQPSRMFYKSVRGMIPHKLLRGKQALARLKVFEGIPPPYDKMKRKVVPSALRVLRLGPTRKYCTLKRISHEVGWKYQKVINKLEEKRKVRSHVFHERKVALKTMREKARKNILPVIKHQDKIIKSYGYE